MQYPSMLADPMFNQANPSIPYDSFTFNDVNMLTEFGIQVIAVDSIMAPVRRNTIVVPSRSGAYDMTPNHPLRDERTLRIDCRLTKYLSLGELDALKLALSVKGKIIVWDKPDRFYWGILTGAPTWTDFIEFGIRDISLEFTCDPYMYALASTTWESTEFGLSEYPTLVPGSDTRPFLGTADTPALIKILATDDTAVMSGLYFVVHTDAIYDPRDIEPTGIPIAEGSVALDGTLTNTGWWIDSEHFTIRGNNGSTDVTNTSIQNAYYWPVVSRATRGLYVYVTPDTYQLKVQVTYRARYL